MKKIRRIGVLTSGGDTPGMNAAVRAVVKAGIDKGIAVMGIYHGFTGLMEGHIQQLQYADVHNTTDRGGTILRTSRSERFKLPEGKDIALRVIRAYGIDGLIVIGGDGSFRGARALFEAGIPAIGVPGTIDNDMGYTDFTIGFDTAVNNVINEISKIRDTMRAHDRVGVVEVMGRNCGDIALWAGIAGPADITLLPEVEYSWADAAHRLAENKLRGRLTSMVIIAEGAGHADDFAEYVRQNTDVEIKPVTLSYIQRGGNPSANDRVLATRLGVRAVELLFQGEGGRAVGIRDNALIDVTLEEAINTPNRFNQQLYDLMAMITKF
ncbi:6-phosphofructokinase [Christensenellaceae bacterium OttesenSCG-928-L17]|nr:6-phosphofructokinase [Christensenellaceae bacterium OttesenSCG-928-L17]